MDRIFKIEFYVPPEYCEIVKEAMFAAGAGRLGNYDCCAWQTATGRGQFRPLPGSQPCIGRQGNVEYLQEVKVEMICREEYLAQALTALQASHPYETPALQYWPVNEPV